MRLLPEVYTLGDSTSLQSFWIFWSKFTTLSRPWNWFHMSFGLRVSMTWLKPPRSGTLLNRVTRLWGDCLKNWADQALEKWFVCHTVRSNTAASARLGSLLPMSTRAQPAKSKKLTVRLTCTWTCIRVRMRPENDKPISRSLRLARLPFLLLKSEMDCACGKVLRRKDCDSASDKQQQMTQHIVVPNTYHLMSELLQTSESNRETPDSSMLCLDWEQK